MPIELKPLIFVPRENYEAKAKIYYMDFPKQLIEDLKDVYGVQWDRNKVTLPVKTLNGAVIALFPEVISFSEERNFLTGRRWLAATREVEIELIRNLIKVWINEEILEKAEKEENKVKVRNAITLFDNTQLKWECVETEIFQVNKFSNGTSKPEDGYFDAVPEYLCNKLCSMEKCFTVNGITLPFRRSGKAEMMSWPPQFYEKGDKKHYYSIVISFSVETIPFYSMPVILMKSSTRRFISESLVSESGYVKLPWDNDTSVFLSSQSYWYDSNQSSAFTKARLGYKYYDKEIYWTEKLSKILNALNIHSSLPEAKELALNPVKYIENSAGVNALIVKSNFTEDNHFVGTGVSMKDLRELSEQVSENLPELKKLEEVKRLNIKMQRIELFEKPINIEAEKRREALADTLKGTLKLEIRYETDEIKEALHKAIIDIFGLEGVPFKKGSYQTPELELALEILPIGNKISAPLEGKNGHLDRIKYVQSAVAETSITTGTFIELDGKSSWKKKNSDPKVAIREGFGKRGRLTQFITPTVEETEKDKVKLRAENAVWDMLRQMGYMPGAPTLSIKNGNIPTSLSIFGLWLIKTNYSDYKKQITFPVAVYMNTQTNEIKVKCPLFNNSWMDYGKALLEICKYNNILQSQEKRNNKFNLNKNEIHNFIRLLLNEISDLGPSLLLVDSTNLRTSWGWISDKNIDKQQIWVGDLKDKDKDECKLNMTKFKDLRIVKIRKGEEVPIYYGKEGEEAKYTSGLYEAFEGVFWSLASKPITMVSSKLGRSNSSRLESPTKDFKYQNLIEITPIFLKEGDNPEEWGYAVHRMRDMLAHFNDAAELPVNLHLGKKMEEYICQVE